MDKTQAIKAVLDEPRNGADSFIRYSPLTPRFIITDGVRDLAEAAGCYWMLDILGTEVEPKLRASINRGDVATAFVEFDVKDGAGWLRVTTAGDTLPYWNCRIHVTDFPEGEWTLFEMGALEWDDSGLVTSVVCTLLSEH